MSNKYYNTTSTESRGTRRQEKLKGYAKKKAIEYIQSGLCRACGGPREEDIRQHCNKCNRRRESARLKNLYGITIEEYEELSAFQGHVCWICGNKETTKNCRLHVDHCHDTNKIRGLLCAKCNQGLGCFKHKPDLFRQAMKYLEETKD